MKPNYRFKPRDPNFQVSAIWHDDRFTYIRASPQEAPSVYEEKDGKPSSDQFPASRWGASTLDRIVSRGYLAIGNKKLHFAVEE